LVFFFLALLALDMGGAARELAHSVAAALEHAPVVLSIRNQTTLGGAEVAAIRRAFESELQLATVSAVEVRITVATNLTQYVLVAEVRHPDAHPDERRVFLQAWPRATAPPAGSQGAAARVTFDRKLLYEEEQPILDVARAGAGSLVLDTTRVLLLGGWGQQTALLSAGRAWPRDTRGRLLVNDKAFTAWLPGTVCRGSIQPRLTVQCGASQEAWPLAPGAVASFASTANYFDGRVTLAAWGEREVLPFYSAAPVGDLWVFAGVDGRARLYSRSGALAAGSEPWGSDLAVVQTPCGARVLTTRSTGPAEVDAIQPFAILEGAAAPGGPALEFPGPITALWSLGETATVVSHDLETRRYAAFSLVPACGS
jgi:hypothetical protein